MCLYLVLLQISNLPISILVRISYRIHDIVRVTSSSSFTTLCLQFFDVSSNLTPPTDSSLFDYQPIQQFFADKNCIINNNNSNIALPTRKLRRKNMLNAKINSNVSQMPMFILRHPNAADFMAAFASEIASLQDMHTFIPCTDNVNLIPKGSLLSSKAIFNIVYNPDGTFQKLKARLVARGDQLKNIFDPGTYARTVSSPTLRLLLSLAAEEDMDFVSMTSNLLSSILLYNPRKRFI